MMKQTYGFVPKAEVIKAMKKTIEMLENSDEVYVFVTQIDRKHGECKSERNTIEEGIALIDQAISVAYSTTHVMGSVDLFDYYVTDINKIDLKNLKMKNLLFPIITKNRT